MSLAAVPLSRFWSVAARHPKWKYFSSVSSSSSLRQRIISKRATISQTRPPLKFILTIRGTWEASWSSAHFFELHFSFVWLGFVWWICVLLLFQKCYSFRMRQNRRRTVCRWLRGWGGGGTILENHSFRAHPPSLYLTLPPPFSFFDFFLPNITERNYAKIPFTLPFIFVRFSEFSLFSFFGFFCIEINPLSYCFVLFICFVLSTLLFVFLDFLFVFFFLFFSPSSSFFFFFFVTFSFEFCVCVCGGRGGFRELVSYRLLTIS